MVRPHTPLNLWISSSYIYSTITYFPVLSLTCYFIVFQTRSVRQSWDPPAIHPTVKKYLGKTVPQAIIDAQVLQSATVDSETVSETQQDEASATDTQQQAKQTNTKQVNISYMDQPPRQKPVISHQKMSATQKSHTNKAM